MARLDETLLVRETYPPRPGHRSFECATPAMTPPPVSGEPASAAHQIGQEPNPAAPIPPEIASTDEVAQLQAAGWV